MRELLESSERDEEKQHDGDERGDGGEYEKEPPLTGPDERLAEAADTQTLTIQAYLVTHSGSGTDI